LVRLPAAVCVGGYHRSAWASLIVQAVGEAGARAVAEVFALLLRPVATSWGSARAPRDTDGQEVLQPPPVSTWSGHVHVKEGYPTVYNLREVAPYEFSIHTQPILRSLGYMPSATYSSFQISVWRSGTCKRSPWLCLALTLPSPGGRGGIGKALVESEDIGLIKLSADVRSGEILGGHIVAPAAGEMIHEIVAAMTARATVRDLADAIHAFPTFAEGIKVTAGEWMNAHHRVGRPRPKPERECLPTLTSELKLRRAERVGK
jgi:hypothetical protein